MAFVGKIASINVWELLL